MQIKQTHRVILKFLLYSVFRGKYEIKSNIVHIIYCIFDFVHYSELS